MIYRGELMVATRGRGTYDITRDVERLVAASRATEGLATIWIAHTSASLIVCENADPSVRSAPEAFPARPAPSRPGRGPPTPPAGGAAPALALGRACAPRGRPPAAPIAVAAAAPSGALAATSGGPGSVPWPRGLALAHLGCGYTAVVALD